MPRALGARHTSQTAALQPVLELNCHWQRLVDDARISLTPGQVFHSTEPGWFRLCHATDPEHLREGVTRLGQVLGADVSTRVATRP